MIQAAAGFYTYFYILNDYGIRPSTLFFLASKEGVFPAPEDEYSPLNEDGNYGNSNVARGGE